MSVEQKIREIITEIAEGLDGNLIKMDSPLIESGLDSLDYATVLLEIQENFDVMVPEGEEDSYDTLSKLVEFVELKQST